MKEQLLPYYERELQFFSEMAKEFGRDHPKQAGRLGIEGGKSTDPHVERLIQAFSLIAGRIRHKLDDEFPEITEALLGILYPHYIRPVPSMAIAQFQIDPSQSRAAEGYSIPRGTQLSTRTVAGLGVPCRFRTAYPVTLWPLRIVSAQMVRPASLNAASQVSEVSAALRLVLEGLGGATAASMKLKTLRFCLQGEGDLPYTLYELLLNNVRQVHLSPFGDENAAPFRFPRNPIRSVGFEENEGLLPLPPSSFIGYRLLSEYFSFPEKFLFFDLTGFDQLPLKEVGGRFELTFLLGEFERKDRLRTLERSLRSENFQLGCTPIVNLFSRPAEPIRVSHTKTEYRVIPDAHSPRSAEVYSIDKVTSVASYLEESREYRPFYGLQHSYEDDAPKAFWFATRRPSPAKDDNGTEVYLSLVDTNFRATDPATEALSVFVTCTNRDLPAQLPLTSEFGDLCLEGSAGVRARCLAKPTETLRPPLQSALQWRLISHLALNYASLADGNADALREILTLYNYSDNPVGRNQIAGISSVSSKPHMTRILTPVGVAFALGLRVHIEFDEERYVDNGAFVLASVLERFLGLYCSVNSFTQLRATSRQRKGVLRTWLPRAGSQILA